jgi:anti-sigma factor RsiW
MSNERDPEWMEQLHRGKLDPASRARWRRELAARPDEAERFEAELALEEVLGQLPRAELPSNFTAQVVQALEQQERVGRRREGVLRSWWQSFRWARQLAAATIIAAVLTGVWQVRMQQRTKLARNVADVAQATGAGNLAVENLKDFEAIQLLGQTPRPDDVELLAALSQ